jgi:replicative DNA helicase
MTIAQLDLRRAHPNDPAADRVPSLPASIDAEQALLGAVLYDNAAFHVVEHLEGRHFFEPLHGRLWDAMAAKIGKGVLAEPIDLAERLASDAAFEELGGVAYLADLVDQAPPTSNAPSYAATIKATSRRRDLITLSQEVGKGAREAEEPEEVINYAEAALLAMQATTRSLTLTSAAMAAARVLDRLDAPAETVRGIQTGLAPLDEELGPLLAGNLMLFMGRPGMGKSAAAECVALNISRQGYGVIQINGEMTEEEMAQRHLSDLCQERYGFRGPEYRDIRRRRIGYDQRQMLRSAQEDLEPLPLMMLKRSGLKFSQLRSIARRQVAAWSRQGVELGALIVDHMGLVRPDQPTKSRYDDQTIISGATKELAEELGCPVIALNQMNRQNESRDDKRPQLSDLRDSGSWEQDADYVIGWYREAYYAQKQTEPKKDMEISEWLRAKESRSVEAIILKNRHGAGSTVKLWGDVARNAIRGAAPEGELF